jgi:hypothetical protein
MRPSFFAALSLFSFFDAITLAIMAFRPSESTQQRIRQLLAANKVGQLSADEVAELDEFEQVEHFVRMLKLHTQELLSDS